MRDDCVEKGFYLVSVYQQEIAVRWERRTRLSTMRRSALYYEHVDAIVEQQRKGGDRER